MQFAVELIIECLEVTRCKSWLWCKTYGFAAPHTAIALIGSHGHLELAVNYVSAALDLQLQVGDAVAVYC